MKLLRKLGATSEIWQIFIADSSSTTGAGLTGLVFNTASLTAYYHRDTDTTATAITLVTMTVGTFTSSGFKEIDATNMPGWYQFCPPNAAIASGAKSCAFHLKGATNMAPLPIEVDLDGQVDVTSWNGTAVSSPATAGIPDVNVKNMNNVAATSITTINANQGTTQPLNFTGTAGSALVKTDVTDIATVAVSATTAQLGVNVVNWNNTVVATPATAGIPDVNAKNINNVATTSVTTINANQGTTQPINFTGTAGSALVKSDMVDVAGAAVSATSAQLGVNVVNINAVAASSVTAVAANIGHSQPLNFTGTAGSALVKSDMVDVAGSAVSTSTAQIGTNVVSVAGGASNIKKNQALAKFEFLMTDSTTHAPKTGVTVTATRSIDGGAFGACANAVTELASGIYYIDLAAADLNGNVITLRFTGTASDDRLVTLVTQP